MVVCTQEGHTDIMASEALELMEAASRVELPFEVASVYAALQREEMHMASFAGGGVTIRAGLHSGPVVAGVMGNLVPRFCLCGTIYQLE